MVKYKKGMMKDATEKKILGILIQDTHKFFTLEEIEKSTYLSRGIILRYIETLHNKDCIWIREKTYQAMPEGYDAFYSN